MATWMVQFKEWYSQQHPAVKVLVVVGGGAVAVGFGIVAAPAVGAVASAAGLGVAGGTLSGAAASSAGLAALGGGSIASGGLGMVGGTAVVASVTGAAGAGAASYASLQTDREGARLDSLGRQARAQRVENDGVRFES